MGKILKIIIFAVVVVTLLVIGDLTPITAETFTITSGMAVPIRVALQFITTAFSYPYINKVLIFYITLYVICTLIRFIFDKDK